MKRVLCLLLIACSIHVWGQDFASKFMEQCAKEDGEIQCQTVSPIMMEKLMDTMTAPNGDRDEEVPEYLLSKLKSARIITATKQSEKLFREAEQLIQPDLARRTADEIVPAHDLGHAGQAVIHHDRQLIRKHAIRPPDDEVAALLGKRFSVIAVHAVRERDGSLGHAHARCRRTLSALFGHLLGC